MVTAEVPNSRGCSGEVLENISTNSALPPILSWKKRLYLELIGKVLSHTASRPWHFCAFPCL